MNVTLRPNGVPDVYIQDSGRSCNLADLDKEIRALVAARKWLEKETENKKIIQK